MKQLLISVGQAYGRIIHPYSGGDARVLHAYIVLQTFPSLGRLRVADAARDDKGRRGVGESVYDFRTCGPDNPGGMHLFYRFVDARLARRVRDRAQAWAGRPAANFSNSRAAMAPFRNWGVFSGARRHIRHLMAHSPARGPVPQLYGRGPYPLMCSNFVSSVCVPEIIQLYCADQGVPATVTPLSLRALKVGSAGLIFDSDPRWVLPGTLQALFAGSRAATPVGAINAVH